MGPEQWATIRQHLGGGDGGELVAGKTGTRPKFCSAFSSAALVANVFGPFVRGAPVSPPGVGTYETSTRCFEAKRTAGTRGYRPNLDLVLEPPASDWAYLESKCLEYLRPHTTAFSDAFVKQAKTRLSSPTHRVYKRFQDRFEKRDGYELLDTAQLLEHFLAAKIAADHKRALTFVYAYWEPLDAGDHPVFAAHRAEAQRLAADLVDDEVRLVHTPYPRLWDAWEGSATDHVELLRARYGVPIVELRDKAERS